MPEQQLTNADDLSAAFDRRNADWYIDKLVQALVFIGGISAIIFVIGIFAFVTKEGFGFLLDRFDFRNSSPPPTGTRPMRTPRNTASWR